MLVLRFERQGLLTVDLLKVAAAADYRVVSHIEGINLTSSSRHSFWLCVSSLPAQVLVVKESEPLVLDCTWLRQCCSIQIPSSKAWGCGSQPNRRSAGGRPPVDDEHKRREAERDRDDMFRGPGPLWSVSRAIARATGRLRCSE